MRKERNEGKIGGSLFKNPAKEKEIIAHVVVKQLTCSGAEC